MDVVDDESFNSGCRWNWYCRAERIGAVVLQNRVLTLTATVGESCCGHDSFEGLKWWRRYMTDHTNIFSDGVSLRKRE